MSIVSNMIYSMRLQISTVAFQAT